MTKVDRLMALFTDVDLAWFETSGTNGTNAKLSESYNPTYTKPGA